MKNLLAIIIILILVVLGTKGWWIWQLSPVSEQKDAKDITIAPGASLREIADQLRKDNLIRSSLIFTLYVRQKGLGSSLQAGMFRVSPSVSTEQIVNILTQGPEGVWVKLLEGVRIEEMAEEVSKQLKIEKKDFLKVAKEGYMFPDSYLFPREATAEYVATTLRNTFEERFNDVRAKIKAQGLTEEEGVILASIVEREARSDEARRMVAAILLKRFKMNMGLNADATIQYALGYQKGEKSWWKRHLSLDDLKIDSPYNTYLYNGLPPAPICNPGLASLKAVANADTSAPYLYYYHDSKGNSYYAKTLEEHNQNVANHP